MYIRFYVEMNSLSKSAFHVCVCREKVILSVDTDRSEIIGQIAVRDKLGQNRELRTKLEEQWGSLIHHIKNVQQFRVLCVPQPTTDIMLA